MTEAQTDDCDHELNEEEEDGNGGFDENLRKVKGGSKDVRKREKGRSALVLFYQSSLWPTKNCRLTHLLAVTI